MSKLEDLASQLSGLSGSPVYFAEKPQDVNNCIVFHQISSTPIHSMEKQLLEYPRIQMDIYGDSLASSRTLAQTVKDGIDCQMGLLVGDYITKDVDSNLTRTILDFIIF